MHISKVALLAAQLSSVLAVPTRGSVVRPPFPSLSVAAGASETLPPTPAKTGAPTPEEGDEEEGGENEIEQFAEFDVPIVVPGGGKVDTLYPPGVGFFHNYTFDPWVQQTDRDYQLNSKTASLRSKFKVPTTAP